MSYKNPEFMNNNIPPDIYDDEFIGLINGLNESIKEHYKVSKHNMKETNNFLSLFDGKFTKIKNNLNQTLQTNSLNNINEIYQDTVQSQIIVDRLQNNSKSFEGNLNSFFKDAKILFKKMKIKRNENLALFGRKLRNKSNSNLNDNNKGDTILVKKIIIKYLNQLKDYNDIIGKFSVKAKSNFINLQKMIFNVVNNDGNLDENDFLQENNNNHNDEEKNNTEINKKEVMDLFEIRKKYEKEISILNNKIKDLERKLNENRNSINKTKELDKVLALEQEDEKYNNLNKLITNSKEASNSQRILNTKSRNNNSTLELRKELKNLYKENDSLRNEINKMRTKMTEMTQSMGGALREENFEKIINNDNDNEQNINEMKKELEKKKKNNVHEQKKLRKRISCFKYKNRRIIEEIDIKNTRNNKFTKRKYQNKINTKK